MRMIVEEEFTTEESLDLVIGELETEIPGESEAHPVTCIDWYCV